MLACRAERAYASMARYRGPRSCALLASFFGDADAAAVVGRRYLALHPSEADLDRLGREILSPTPARAYQAHTRQVLARHRDDFASEHLAIVDGWVLSRTEARLCAIAALARDASRDR
jgi:hypothetical protein